MCLIQNHAPSLGELWAHILVHYNMQRTQVLGSVGKFWSAIPTQGSSGTDWSLCYNLTAFQLLYLPCFLHSLPGVVPESAPLNACASGSWAVSQGIWLWLGCRVERSQYLRVIEEGGLQLNIIFEQRPE